MRFAVPFFCFTGKSPIFPLLIIGAGSGISKWVLDRKIGFEFREDACKLWQYFD
jgi:hypothetical protein